MKNTKYIKLLIFVSVISFSCEKFVAVDPPITATTAGNVYTNNATAAAVLTGVYTNMSREGFTAQYSILPALLADELEMGIVNESDYYFCYINSLTPIQWQTDLWTKLYYYIFVANSATEGLESSSSLTPAVKQQLLGEARFLRAFFYFYLVNYYGDAPLALSTNYRINTSLPRTPKADLYRQIIQDLKDAKALLNEQYVEADAVTVKTGTGRVRPTKWAAAALLSKAYLYSGDYVNAEAQATEVISHNSLFELLPLSEIFLKNSRESIWQLQVVGVDYGANTEEGRKFILPAGGPTNSSPVYLRKSLAAGFEKGDQRRKNWIDSVIAGGQIYHYAKKYKIGPGISVSTEYPVVLRLAEQYLIRAEARILNNDIDGGIDDLNVLRTRATDMSALPADRLVQLQHGFSKPDALKVLEHERLAEMFTEMGNRWLDLKRTPGFTQAGKTRADEVLSIIKGSNWQSTDQLFPIPQNDMTINPNLAGHQNPGY